MTLTQFYIIATLVYCGSMLRPLRELWVCPKAEWGQRQTIPLLLALTTAYLVAVIKTHSLAALFAGC